MQKHNRVDDAKRHQGDDVHLLPFILSIYKCTTSEMHGLCVRIGYLLKPIIQKKGTGLAPNDKPDDDALVYSEELLLVRLGRMQVVL